MKSIILCEGSTDFALIQYYMRTVYAWEDKNPNKKLAERNFKLVGKIQNNHWTNIEFFNGRKRKKTMEILLLAIPFEDTGAMETFLLNAIAQKDSYDAYIIDRCNKFVDTVDIERRYLTKRRYITKSKFDVYFSIRTAVDQFQQRQDILKSIKWEDYELIQKSFKLLKDLSY